MRRQKRFEKREQIVSVIEDTKQQHIDDCARAEGLDAEATILFNWVNEKNDLFPRLNDMPRKLRDEYNQNLHSAQQLRDQANKIRKRQGSVPKKLERLKRTLANFDTVPMSILPDASVVMA